MYLSQNEIWLIISPMDHFPSLIGSKKRLLSISLKESTYSVNFSKSLIRSFFVYILLPPVHKNFNIPYTYNAIHKGDEYVCLWTTLVKELPLSFYNLTANHTQTICPQLPILIT